MEEELEAYPSIEGAVHKTACGNRSACASTLQQSLITPDPTASTPSHAVSNCHAEAAHRMFVRVDLPIRQFKKPYR